MAQNVHSFTDKVVIVTVRVPIALHLAVTLTPTRLTVGHRVATGRSERNRVCGCQGKHHADCPFKQNLLPNTRLLAGLSRSRSSRRNPRRPLGRFALPSCGIPRWRQSRHRITPAHLRWRCQRGRHRGGLCQGDGGEMGSGRCQRPVRGNLAALGGSGRLEGVGLGQDDGCQFARRCVPKISAYSSSRTTAEF